MIDKMLIRGAKVHNLMRQHFLSDLSMEKAVDLF